MSEGTNKKPIELSHERIFCPRHGEPFRERWPKGAPIVMLELFQAVLESKEARQKRFEGKIKDNDALAAMVGELLDEEPACCRVSLAELKAAYVASDIGIVMQCVVCVQAALGTPYATSTQKFAHVCFDCILHRMVVTN